MSQFRLARISLMLAAIGLNALPALLPSAHAKGAPEATAEAPKPDTVRAELFKLIDPATIQAQMNNKQFAEVEAKLKAANAFPELTAYESYIINRMQLALGSASKNDPMAMTALEAVIASGRLVGTERDNYIQALANYYYNAKNYTKAIEWLKRYQEVSAKPMEVRDTLARAHYLAEDYTAARDILLPAVADAEKAGKTPPLEDLRLLVSAAGKLKDMPVYVSTMEKLVAFYPSEDFWVDLLSRMVNKQSFDVRLQLDAYRLQHAAVGTLTDDEYVEMAEAALLAGFPTEAKTALDAGFKSGVLGTGSGAAKHKQLRSRADKGSADDTKSIGSGEAPALKSKDGLGLVNLGYAYVTMGQFDKGIDLMEKGIAKGVKKRPEDARLHLGVAYGMAGRKADAIKIFETMKAGDGLADLGKYWILWLNRPAAAAADAAPAAEAAPAPAAAN